MSTAAKLEPIPAKHTKGATARKLIQAAALAAMLVPLGSVAVEAESIICRFNNTGSGFYGGDGCGGGDSSPDANTSRFDFGAYFFELDFTLIGSQDFDVTVTNFTNLSLDHGEEGELFPGYVCIALSEADGCVDFQVSTTGTSGTNWSHYKVAIDWSDWNDLLSPGMEPRMRMLHDSSASETGGAEDPGTYDFDMCITAGYDLCVNEVDPRGGSGDTDFDSFMETLAPTPIPEPSSLILLATGVSGVLFRRRRRT